jgi:hypothetical protein
VGTGLGVAVGVGVRVGKGVAVRVAVLVARGGNVGRPVGSTVGVHITGTSAGVLVIVGVGIWVGSGARIERMTMLPKPTITATSRMAKMIKMIFCPRLNVFIESFLRPVGYNGLARHFVMPLLFGT